MPGRRPSTSLLEQALAASRGSRKVELEGRFDPDEPGGWCELLKDVAAMANSGGGVILVDLEGAAAPGVAEIVDRLASYAGERFEAVEVREATKGEQQVAAIEVGARTVSPLVFEKAGAYVDAEGRSQEAFARGTVWFRHGARSQPALARDVARFASREETRVHQELLRNLRRVSTAPTGSQVLVVPPGSAPVSAVDRVRVVDDPSAPAVARTDFDVTHPHRQKEVIAAVNDRVGSHLINAFDFLCVRRVHGIDEQEQFFHHPRFGSPQYSDAFIDWLVASYQHDHAFFDAAKAEYAATHPRRSTTRG